jgi:hypothetical protein
MSFFLGLLDDLFMITLNLVKKLQVNVSPDSSMV